MLSLPKCFCSETTCWEVKEGHLEKEALKGDVQVSYSRYSGQVSFIQATQGSDKKQVYQQTVKHSTSSLIYDLEEEKKKPQRPTLMRIETVIENEASDKLINKCFSPVLKTHVNELGNLQISWARRSSI